MPRGISRGGQILFTQPTLREDTKYSNNLLVSSAQAARAPKLTQNYEQKQAPKINADQAAQSTFYQNYNSILTEAETYARTMSNIINEAGGQSNMNAEQYERFKDAQIQLQFTQFKRDQLMSTVDEIEEDFIQANEDEEMLREKGISDDYAVQQVGSVYIGKSAAVRGEGGEIVGVSPIKNSQEIELLKQTPITWNDRTKSYDFERYNPANNYEYKGQLKKYMTDLMAAASNQYDKDYIKVNSNQIYTVDPDTGMPTVNKDNQTLLAWYLMDETQETNARAVSAVKDALWENMMLDSNAMADLGQQTARLAYENPTSLYTEKAFKEVKDGEEVDKNLAYTRYNTKTKESETIMLDTESDDVKVLQKINREGFESLNAQELNTYINMQKEYVFKSTKEFEKVYSSYKYNKTYRKMGTGDIAGNMLPERTKSSMRENYNNWWYVKSMSGKDGEDNTITRYRNVVKDGKVVPVQFEATYAPYTGNAKELLDYDNQDAMGEGIENLKKEEETGTDAAWIGGGINPTKYENFIDKQKSVQHITGQNQVMTASGNIIDLDKVSAEGFKLYGFTGRDVWMPGYKKVNGRYVPTEPMEGDQYMQRFQEAEVFFSETQAENANMTYGYSPEYKDIDDYTVANFNPDEWTVVSDDKEFGTFTQLKDTNWLSENLDSEQINELISIYGGTGGYVQKGDIRIPYNEFIEQVGEYPESAKGKTFTIDAKKYNMKMITGKDDIVGSEKWMKEFGIEKVGEVNTLFNNEILYKQILYIPTSAYGLTDPSKKLSESEYEIYENTVNNQSTGNGTIRQGINPYIGSN